MRDEQKQIPKMKTDDLWREDVFTDRHIGTIRRMTPVTIDGSDDPKRKLTFVGSTSLLTPGGTLPLSFEIDATNLAEAVAKFSDAAEDALQETLREIAAMRREAASGLVIPDASDLRGLGGPGGLGGGGGLIRP